MTNINDQYHDKNDHQDSGEPIPIWSRWLSPFSTFSWLLLLLALLATLLVLWWESAIVIKSSRPITFQLSFGSLICEWAPCVLSIPKLTASSKSEIHSEKGTLKIKAKGLPSLSSSHPLSSLSSLRPLWTPCPSPQHLARRLSVRLSPSERRSRAPLSDLLLRLVAPWLPFNNYWSARAASAKCATAGPVCRVWATCRSSLWCLWCLSHCRLIRTPPVHEWGVYMISPFQFTLIQVCFVSSPSIQFNSFSWFFHFLRS